MRGISGRGRRWTAAIIAIAAALTIVPATSASGYHSDRQAELQDLIARKRSQIAQVNAEEQDLLSRLNESSARQAALEAQLRSIEAELAVARDELVRIERRLDQATEDLRVKTAELENTQADLDERTEILNGRVAEMYTSAPESYTAVFRLAEDFEDIVAGTEFVGRVVSFDRQLLDEIEVVKAELEVQRAQIEEKRDQLTADRAAARATAQEIKAKRDARAGARAQVAREVNYQRFLLGELRSKKSKFQRVLESYEQENREITDFLRGAQSGQQAIQGRGGWLKWPVSGRITSGYGWRTHPVYGYRSFHTGIDIGAPSDATVKAARTGVVLSADYRGAYGLTVIVDHGNAVATMYAHLNRTFVRAGEHVSTLETIGAVGSTGWSTGPHLHFEVRVNGEHQNPMRWL